MDYREKSQLLYEKRERAKRTINDLSEEEANELIDEIRKLDAELKKEDENVGISHRPIGGYYKKLRDGE